MAKQLSIKQLLWQWLDDMCCRLGLLTLVLLHCVLDTKCLHSLITTQEELRFTKNRKKLRSIAGECLQMESSLMVWHRDENRTGSKRSVPFDKVQELSRRTLIELNYTDWFIDFDGCTGGTSKNLLPSIPATIIAPFRELVMKAQWTERSLDG